MTKVTDDAIRWAIANFYSTKTDAQIAKGLNITEAEVRVVRSSMGITTDEAMKAFAGRMLAEMPDNEKREWLKDVSKDLIWKMAEGSPTTSGTLDVKTDPVKIDITHQLVKVYGKPELADAGGRPDIVPEYSEVGG